MAPSRVYVATRAADVSKSATTSVEAIFSKERLLLLLLS